MDGFSRNDGAGVIENKKNKYADRSEKEKYAQ
jgi:hypothetical protein